MRPNFDDIFKYWVPVILWMSFIFWMSTEMFSAEHTSSIIEPVLRFLMPGISAKGLDMAHVLIRKFGHVSEYFVLGFLLFRALHGSFAKSQIRHLAFLSVLGVTLYAAGDELHQLFVSARTASIIDVGIDTTGGILSQIACILRYHRRLT